MITRSDLLGLILRVGLFILIGWISLLVFATLLFWLTQNLLIAGAMSSFAAALLANAVTVRIYERGELTALGLQWIATSKREFLLGIGGGFGAACLVLLLPLSTGAAFFEKVPSSEHILPSLAFVSVILLFGAFGEEMLFHGYAFQLLVRRMGAFATILPAAVIFGLAHADNPSANLAGICNTMLWGLLFGYAYLRTSALWLPIGLHFGWNVALPLFGANLSGFGMSVTGYALRWKTTDLWSGGGYGPEGSILTTFVVVLLFFAVHRYTVVQEPE
jgi:membrane protease YdiL (CAAX protease family)